MENLLIEWASWQRAAGLSERTITERASCVRTLYGLATNEAATLTRRDVLRFLGRRDLRPATRATYYSTLTVFFKWCIVAGHRLDSPMEGLAAPKRPRGVPQPVTGGNMLRLLQVLNRRKTRAMVFLTMYAGLRVHEVAKIRGEDFDLHERTLRLTGKGGKVAVLPLHDELATLAKIMPAQGWWFPANEGRDDCVTPHAVSRAIGRAMHRAGFEGHAHQLRHWFGSELRRKKVDLRTAQELLRHSNLASTQIYTLVNDDARRDGIDAISAPSAAKRAA